MKMPLRREPAVRHGLIVGVVAALLTVLGIELSDTDLAALDSLILAAVVALPVVQAIVQAVWTRSRVMPTRTIREAGLVPYAINERARRAEWERNR